MRPLTSRQKQIAGMVARGKPTKVIARELGISRRTAEHHIQQAAARLNGSGEESPRNKLTIWFFEYRDAA